MEKSYELVIRELRRVKDAPNSHTKKNKKILKKLITDIADLIATAAVEMSTTKRGEGLKKYREFKSLGNENRSS